MSQTVKLPFKLELNAPISGLLMNPRTPTGVSKEISKELALVMNKLFRIKLKQHFVRVRNCNKNLSVERLFSQLVQGVRQKKKEQKPSYLHYAVQSLPTQPPVPKTPLFNLRIRQLKQSAFFQLKSFILTQKNEQLTTVLINRQSELLNHLIPKIEEKILIYGLRKMIEYSKEQKGRFLIVKVLERLSKVVMKRVAYSEFFNKAKKLTSVKSKQELVVRKLSKISNQSSQLLLQQSFNHLQLYSQSFRLENIITQKKHLIQQVYSRNTERTVLVQQEREALRNLKYKLDQEVVEKSHVLTDKRRALMLMKARVNEEGKVMDGERVRVEGDVVRLGRVKWKEEVIVKRLNEIRKVIELHNKDNHISYEQIITSIYNHLIELPIEQEEESPSSITNTNNNSLIQNLEKIIQTVVNDQLQLSEYEEEEDSDMTIIPRLENIEQSKLYQYRRVELLEQIVRYMEGNIYINNNNNNKNSNSSSRITSLNSSVYSNRPNVNNNPLTLTPRQQKQQSQQQNNNTQNNNVSSSLFTPTMGRTLSQSRLIGSSSNGNLYNNMGNSNINNTTTISQSTITLNINEPLEYTRTREELFLIKQIISMIITKRYELQIKNAITDELEQLSELLVSDMMMRDVRGDGKEQKEGEENESMHEKRIEKESENKKSKVVINGNGYYSNGDKNEKRR